MAHARLVGIGGGVELSVGDDGTGPAVVLLHGWPVTTYHWRRLAPALVAAGFRVLAVEPRGLGGSSTGPGPFDKATLAAEVGRLVTHLGLEAVAVVGHDWGATIGYLLAAELRGTVRALVVEEEMLPGIDADIPEPGRSRYPTWHGPLNRAPGLAEAVVPGNEDAYYGTFLRESAGPVPLDEDAVDAYLRAYRPASCLAASLGYYRTTAEDAEAVRSRAATPLAAPVQTLGGEFGMGSGVAASFAQVAGSVDHRRIDGAGHYPAEQRPEIVNGLVVPFVARHMRTT